jgi:TetR/AcrR family transcriptional regulator, fatty acid metabolism regulator protein
MKQSREDKIENILKAAVVVLADRGYESASIKEIASEAKVNWGLLHYYFKDKEDLVAKALRFSSKAMSRSSMEPFSTGKSPQEIADGAIETLKKNWQENPTFYKFLFEMWCASGRSKKIRAELINCINLITESLRIELERLHDVSRKTVNSTARYDAKSTARLLLAISDGLAFQLIHDPQHFKDENLWQAFKDVTLSLLQQ